MKLIGTLQGFDMFSDDGVFFSPDLKLWGYTDEDALRTALRRKVRATSLKLFRQACEEEGVTKGAPFSKFSAGNKAYQKYLAFMLKTTRKRREKK